MDIERCRNEILSELDPNFSGEPEEAAAGSSGTPDDKKKERHLHLKHLGAI